ncbi:MAG: 50S ribosomal protein L23 [Nitrosomonas sp.]|nr:50S ribosomal protein L23 [Nitrosomonas sp.]MDP1951365.1 50S ribosomal protein L23 [Nitrosomonas sp.]
MNKIAFNKHERLMQIVLAPQVSEKATFIGEKYKQIIFHVAKNATKLEVKDAIELLWQDQKVKVNRVQIANVKGKKKRFGKFMGKRSDWKKAYISIKEGKEINFTEFSKGETK